MYISGSDYLSIVITTVFLATNSLLVCNFRLFFHFNSFLFLLDRNPCNYVYWYTLEFLYQATGFGASLRTKSYSLPTNSLHWLAFTEQISAYFNFPRFAGRYIYKLGLPSRTVLLYGFFCKIIYFVTFHLFLLIPRIYWYVRSAPFLSNSNPGLNFLSLFTSSLDLGSSTSSILTNSLTVRSLWAVEGDTRWYTI